VGVLDGRRVVEVAIGQGERQDPHERPVPARSLVGGAGADRRSVRLEGPDRRERRPTDVERAVAVGCVGRLAPPRHDPAPLVVGIESHGSRIGRARRREERIGEGERERPVVAPRASRLVVAPVSAELHGPDRP
jgi:hypothetical protein